MSFFNGHQQNSPDRQRAAAAGLNNLEIVEVHHSTNSYRRKLLSHYIGHTIQEYPLAPIETAMLLLDALHQAAVAMREREVAAT